MTAIRIFVCHDVTKGSQRDVQIVNQLRNRLQEAGAEVVAYAGHFDDDGFVSFLHQQLPTCQWFLLFQTPLAVRSPHAHTAVNTALKLVEQKRLQGALRIVAAPSPPQEIPPEWTALITFDATYDYPRAIESLLLVLPLNKMSSTTPTVMASPGSHFASVMLPAPPTYDKPPPASSPLARFGATVQRHRRLSIAILAALLLLTVLGSVFGYMLLNRASLSPAPTQVYGHVYFSSTGLTGTGDTTGVADGLDVNLQNLPPPAAGNTYYAWLLPDKKNTFANPTLLVGHFTPARGNAHFTYTSPTHASLLSTDSRFLVTEESATNPPLAPNANTSTWRYYAELPQVPNPNDANHFSDLDHLRHLLVGDPMMTTGMGGYSVEGGLGVWFYRNVSKLYEWASAASAPAGSTGFDPLLAHRHFIRILDYLDGPDFVKGDVPAGTPLIVAPEGNKPLLTLDSTRMLQGYIYEIELHLGALINSPHSTPDQRAFAGQMDAYLNAINTSLTRMRQDAVALAKMSNAQLLSATSAPLLNDLLNQANVSLSGQPDPTTGARQGGATWIFDHMLQLAQLTVTKYSA